MNNIDSNLIKANFLKESYRLLFGSLPDNQILEKYLGEK